MGTIRHFDIDDHDFVDPTTVYPAAVLPLIPPAELTGTRVRLHHPGADDEPQLFEVEVAPDLELAPHAHDASEVIVVVEGELRFGSRTCRAGSSILVEGGTLYSLRAGPEGARFLNFRGGPDYTYMDRATFVAARKGRAEVEDGREPS